MQKTAGAPCFFSKERSKKNLARFLRIVTL